MLFRFTHSHPFPGGIVMVENDLDLGPSTVEFADGTAVKADWSRDGKAFLLDLPWYRTAKGTQIAPGSWRISRKEDGAWRSDRAGPIEAE